MVGGARLAPPLGEPGTSCHDNRGRLGGCRERGCGGVGSRGAVQMGNCTPGWLLRRPCLLPVFLGIFQAHPRPVLTVQPPLPGSPRPSPRCPPQLRVRFLTPRRGTPSRHPPLGCPGSPPATCTPTCQSPLPSPARSAPSPLHPSIFPDPHLFEVPAGPEPPGSPSRPLGPTSLTLMRTSASMMDVKVCMSSASAMVPPGRPPAPGARSGGAENPGLMQEPVGCGEGWG